MSTHLAALAANAGGIALTSPPKLSQIPCICCRQSCSAWQSLRGSLWSGGCGCGQQPGKALRPQSRLTAPAHDPGIQLQLTAPALGPDSHSRLTAPALGPGPQPRLTAPARGPDSQPQLSAPAHGPGPRPLTLGPDSHPRLTAPALGPAVSTKADLVISA